MNVFLELMTAGRCLKKVYGRLLSDVCGEYGISRIEIDILLFLSNNPEYDTASDIVTLRALPKSNVSAAIEALIQKNMLVKTVDARDRRILHLGIEEPALPVIAKAREKQAQLRELICRGVTREERMLLDTVFTKMYDNLKEAL